MAREILARIPIPEERAAVLDLICYRALLRMIPKLRMLGVVGQEEFRRRLGLAEAPSRKALKWLISLGLARAPTSGPYEIPEAVVETCLRLKETRGPKWWKEVAPAPHKPYKPYGPMSAEHKANLREALRRSWDVRRAQTKTSA